jgi:hypothetical protein
MLEESNGDKTRKVISNVVVGVHVEPSDQRVAVALQIYHWGFKLIALARLNMN